MKFRDVINMKGVNHGRQKRYKYYEANKLKDYQTSKKRSLQGLMGLDTYVLAQKADIIDSTPRTELLSYLCPRIRKQ